MGEDYFLDFQERKEVIKKLKSINFETLKLNAHYNNKWGNPRHGVSIEKAKTIFVQFDKISQIFTRQGVGGKRYSIVYRLSKNKGFYLILLLDENPSQIFDAYYYGGDVNRRLIKKYMGF